jgi:hypothetical protein
LGGQIQWEDRSNENILGEGCLALPGLSRLASRLMLAVTMQYCWAAVRAKGGSGIGWSGSVKWRWWWLGGWVVGMICVRRETHTAGIA